MTVPIRVLIVDDQELVRAGIRLILSDEDDLEVVGERADGDEVVAAVQALRPDVVLLDIRMRRMDGLSALRFLRRLDEAPPVLVLTTFSDDDVLWGALGEGAAGFLLKDSSAADVLRAVRLVAGGGAWIDPGVAGRLISAVRGRPTADAATRSRGERLSAREIEVLQAVARGATNGEIAAQLHVSERTIKAHIGSIFLKLGVRDRAAAIVFAYDTGLVR